MGGIGRRLLLKIKSRLGSFSENYLSRCVNQVTDKSPRQYFNEVVIYLAKCFCKTFQKILLKLHSSSAFLMLSALAGCSSS